MEGRKMKIKVYIKRPDEKVGHSTWISNTLENLQKTVEGYIETVTFGDYVVICNEEGRLRKMPYCCTIHGVDFVGTIIVAGIDGDEFGDCPLSFDEYKRLVSRERQLF